MREAWPDVRAYIKDHPDCSANRIEKHLEGTHSKEAVRAAINAAEKRGDVHIERTGKGLCTHCRSAHSDTLRAWGRARSQKRLPVDVRQQLLAALYAGQPFRAVLRDLGLTSNQVFGLTRTDQEWSTKLEAALTAARCEDLQHGTNAVYIHGCVCSDCRMHQQVRMGRNRD